MSKIIFNEHQRRQIEANPNVLSVADQNMEKHALHEESDYQDYFLIKAVYDRAKGKIGYRGLYMALVDILDTPMNYKKILRLMRKFNLYTKVRRANPYRHIEKSTMAHRRITGQISFTFL